MERGHAEREVASRSGVELREQPRDRVEVLVGPVDDEQRERAVEGLVAAREGRGIADVRPGALVGETAGPGPSVIRKPDPSASRAAACPLPSAASSGSPGAFGLLVPEQVIADEVVLVGGPAAHAAAPSAPSRLRLLRALPRSAVRSAVRRSSSSATWPGTPAGSG